MPNALPSALPLPAHYQSLNSPQFAAHLPLPAVNFSNLLSHLLSLSILVLLTCPPSHLSNSPHISLTPCLHLHLDHLQFFLISIFGRPSSSLRSTFVSKSSALLVKLIFGSLRVKFPTYSISHLLANQYLLQFLSRKRAKLKIEPNQIAYMLSSLNRQSRVIWFCQ